MSRGRPEQIASGRRPAWALLLLAALAAPGCENLFERSGGDGSHPGEQAIDAPDAEAGRQEVAAYLDFIDVLDETDRQGWQTILEHSMDAYGQDASRDRRMRLALVMSRADRGNGDSKATTVMLADARQLFADTVDGQEPTPSLVRKFAQLQSHEIERRLALYEELRSLRAQLAKAHQESQTAQRDRSEAEARVRRIDAALAEANAKLEAVLKIERNIGPTGKETFP